MQQKPIRLFVSPLKSLRFLVSLCGPNGSCNAFPNFGVWCAPPKSLTACWTVGGIQAVLWSTRSAAAEAAPSRDRRTRAPAWQGDTAVRAATRRAAAPAVCRLRTEKPRLRSRKQTSVATRALASRQTRATACSKGAARDTPAVRQATRCSPEWANCPSQRLVTFVWMSQCVSFV